MSNKKVHRLIHQCLFDKKGIIAIFVSGGNPPSVWDVIPHSRSTPDMEQERARKVWKHNDNETVNPQGCFELYDAIMIRISF